jgi:hypothetical protein
MVQAQTTQITLVTSQTHESHAVLHAPRDTNQLRERAAKLHAIGLCVLINACVCMNQLAESELQRQWHPQACLTTPKGDMCCVHTSALPAASTDRAE